MKNKVVKVKMMTDSERKYEELNTKYKELKKFYDDLMYVSGWGGLSYTEVLTLFMNHKYNFQALNVKHEFLDKTIRQFIELNERQIEFLKKIK